ncbi:MAG TPA: JAB domain-containing protein [Pseudonocardiaceae bacterium]|nr:JAB domain-containing protein [Pseudonocardiaceae bacterium]
MAAAVLHQILDYQPVEVFTVLLLNTKCQLLAVHDAAKGDIHSIAVNPSSIFRAALLANAAQIIVGHNHPSGDPTPSPEDIVLTNRLIAAGALIGIDLVDHIIIGDKAHCSFKETGRMPA